MLTAYNVFLDYGTDMSDINLVIVQVLLTVDVPTSALATVFYSDPISKKLAITTDNSEVDYAHAKYDVTACCSESLCCWRQFPSRVNRQYILTQHLYLR